MNYFWHSLGLLWQRGALVVTHALSRRLKSWRSVIIRLDALALSVIATAT